MSSSSHQNRLASESSAYLLQHASNPVDWYPWGDEALERARTLQRPILLSVGYSACHWCHVMERETFENPEIAALMNEQFVCIKVDREERPDVDHLYMKALQGMTGRGGWPMTIFLTPDAEPFFGGTYFPPEDRRGMAGFPRVMQSVSKAWAEKHDEVLESGRRMVAYLTEDRARADEPLAWSNSSRDTVAEALIAPMDPEHGGFGRAPKFPGTMALSLLMEVDGAAVDSGRRELVRLSLDRMAAGGIRDHLGGGFHRYSVDREWLVPHFEKMLYDQALMVRLYTDASRFFGNQEYLAVAVEVLDYLLREMTSPEGGFYSAQDADSEGVEGKFFVWTPEEIREVLGTERADVFCRSYGVSDQPNFEGASILHRVVPGNPPSEQTSAENAEAQLAECRELLLRRRNTRIAPETDRKIVTDWNALTIGAMAIAGQAAGRVDLIDAAVRAADFLRENLFGPQGLRHVYAAGVAKVPAFLDDYAFLGRACLDLFGARPRAEYFETAKRCADTLLEEFLDEENGGFHFSSFRQQGLVARTCDLHDGAVPAGNSVAAELMLRLWMYTGEDRYRAGGEAVVDRFVGESLQNPYGGSHLLAVASRMADGLRSVVIVGEPESREEFRSSLRDLYDPGCTVVCLDSPDAEWLPEALRGKSAPAEGARAYVCAGLSCSPPVATAQELAKLLGHGSAPRPRPE